MMSEKRFERVFLDTNEFIISDKQEEHRDKGSLYLSENNILKLLNEQDNEIKQYKDNLRMCHEKALYWRNKAENIFGDMKTNTELQQENIRLKKELEKLKS